MDSSTTRARVVLLIGSAGAACCAGGVWIPTWVDHATRNLHVDREPSKTAKARAAELEAAMLIHEMTPAECRDALVHANVARLACEMDGQPYAVPVYLVQDGRYLFGFSTMGYKIDCMRANPFVCVEIDDVKSLNEWMSVLVFGTYEELADTPENEAARAHALELLQRRAMWWEPACVAHHDYPISLTPIFYRILINHMTGHRASPDPVEVHPAVAAQTRSWLSRWLDRMPDK